jgi:formylglycine-generating enzyme
MSETMKSCCTPSREPVAESAAGRPVIEPRADACCAHKEMVRVPGGRFLMGDDSPLIWVQDGEGPVREVEVNPFMVDPATVTNREFAGFVEATGYVTEAERFGCSFVFHLHVPKKRRERLREKRAVVGLTWWLSVPGAEWRHPEGDKSGIAGRQEHPVVHISWNDAQAYCQWAGKRLLTEAEWEIAARGGLVGKPFPWGDVFRGNGGWQANIFQGKFPENDTGADGFKGTCPARHFEPNGFGLYNCVGNVWEWCRDWFSPDHHVNQPTPSNPEGPPTGERRMQKGGSFLCHDSYCNRYRISARIGNTPDSSAGNIGFRCAADSP